MVKAIINIDDDTNRTLNLIKAKYNLNDKSEAIEQMAKEYEEHILEPSLRAEYVAEAKRIGNQKTIKIGSAKELRNRYEK